MRINHLIECPDDHVPGHLIGRGTPAREAEAEIFGRYRGVHAHAVRHVVCRQLTAVLIRKYHAPDGIMHGRDGIAGGDPTLVAVRRRELVEFGHRLGGIYRFEDLHADLHRAVLVGRMRRKPRIERREVIHLFHARRLRARISLPDDGTDKLRALFVGHADVRKAVGTAGAPVVAHVTGKTADLVVPEDAAVRHAVANGEHPVGALVRADEAADALAPADLRRRGAVGDLSLIHI